MANRKTQRGQLKRLQHKLIPVNMIICIISLVAAATMFFMPLFQINLGNITSHPEVIKFVDDMVTEALNNEVGSTDDESGDIMANIDVPKIIVPVIDSVLVNIDGNVSMSTYDILQLATSEDPGASVMNLVFSESDGLLKQLTDSLVKAVMDLPKNKQLTDAIEEVVLTTVSTQVKAGLPEEYKNLVDEKEIVSTFKALNDVKSEEEAIQVIDDYLAKLEENNSALGVMNESAKEEIKEMVSKAYRETVEYTKEGEEDNFSIEGMICVAASEALSTEELDGLRGEDGAIDLGALLEKFLGGGTETPEANAGASTAFGTKVVFEGEAGDGEKEETGGSESGPIENPPASGETQPGESGANEEEVYTKYEDLFGAYIKIDEAKVHAQVKKIVDENVGSQLDGMVTTIDDLNQTFPVFYVAFGVFAFCAATWVILFLFAFFRMFSKNKRFTTWYVKIFGCLPVVLFWLLPLVAGWAIPTYFPTLLGEWQWALPVVLSSLGTSTWISGICYVVLWVVMILWAFPIKHKIRKIIKQRKAERY